MAVIECCQVDRKATVYWLKSRLPQFDYELLYEAVCPKCKVKQTYNEFPGLKLAHGGFSYENGRHPQHRVKPKHYDDWLMRKQTDFVRQEEVKHKTEKSTKGEPFVGEHTKMITRSADVASIYLASKGLKAAFY